MGGSRRRLAASSPQAEPVAELRRRGYEVHRDDELINVLDGRSFSPPAG
ncbi:hypothetical protein M8I35_03485 [Micromonospora sp. MSM11]|nr:hypothetical protein [Micromonospora sp. MSM11]MCL7456244.1 hypothetical protein [Micromonospora sp. MSM11]